MARILFIDDDQGGRKMAVFNLVQAGHDVDEADNGRVGLDRFDPGRHDLVITDVRMPGLSGIEVTRSIRQRTKDVSILVITAFGNIETAVEAMKAGAYDFVLKPFSRDQLMLVVNRALEHKRLTGENRDLRRRVRGIERPIIYKSELMARTIDISDRVSPSDASVLITGESGTGKELVARRIHARSNRSDGPFVVVNCAAIPNELVEAELFGHERGAFTGATRSRIGYFRQANKGTIFLDEIGELPFVAQSKLLRVLQENTVDVVGSDQPVEIDVRIITATNQDLSSAVANGNFREDLFYRLNVVEIHVPPLRNRLQDIAPLIEHFVEGFARGREVTIPEDVVEALQQRPWPGNVRELRNICERLVVLSTSNTLSLDALSSESRVSSSSKGNPASSGDWLALPSEGISLLDIEKSVIEHVLAFKQGNVSEAARYLRVPRHILAYRISKYGISKTGNE